MTKRILLSSLLLITMLLTLMMGSRLNAGAAPLAQSGAPTITSDQADYLPGATVILTGAGWASGEAVHISVNDSAGQVWSYSADVVADSGGGFTNQFQLPDYFVANYSVTATGPSSGTATTTFTD